MDIFYLQQSFFCKNTFLINLRNLFRRLINFQILSNYICSNSKGTIMITIGLIKEGKIPADNRVALIPVQCKWVHKNFNSVKLIVQRSSTRCFSDREFSMARIEVKEN